MAHSTRSNVRSLRFRSAAIRSRQFLNGILTVNAVLLAALVWTNVSDGPSTAHAAPSFTQDDQTMGVPNAGAQRERLIAEVRSLRDDIRALDGTLNGGKVKVNVGNLAELKKIMDDAAAKASAPAPRVDPTAAAVTPVTATPPKP
ncbi:MAG: hypothetical protein JNL80_12190 [Phycisphaerae bacterium]|jgi:hypothetical protein|nr:hypothetical protein [Phycisphaerae bacterium]